MEKKVPRVLMIGEDAEESSYLASRLRDCGCECSFARTRRNAFHILHDQRFDLVLSVTSVCDGTLYFIMNLLEGSATTVFYYYVVEDGCWWLPALRRGQKCFGSPAFRSSEFAAHLDKTIQEIEGSPAIPQSVPPLEFRAEASWTPPSQRRPELAPANAERLEGMGPVKRKVAV